MMKAKVLAPNVVQFDGALRPVFCSRLIDAAERAGDWRRSAVVRGHTMAFNGDQRELISTYDRARNSSQAFFSVVPELQELEAELMEAAEEMVSWWAANVCEVPEGRAWEPPYVVRYRVGEQFSRHTDVRRIRKGHFRLYTIVVFLNESKGGDLVFPEQRIAVKNIPGRAVMFPSGDTFPHQSTMITEGVKYSIPLWIYYPELISFYNLKRAK